MADKVIVINKETVRTVYPTAPTPAVPYKAPEATSPARASAGEILCLIAVLFFTFLYIVACFATKDYGWLWGTPIVLCVMSFVFGGLLHLSKRYS